MSDDWPGVLLKIVWREHVIFRGHELFEEAPGAAGDKPERQGVGRSDRQVTGRAWRLAELNWTPFVGPRGVEFKV